MILAVLWYGEGQAETLHMAWMTALAFAILFLAAAIAEFFLLDIRQALALESGMAVRKRLRQISGNIRGNKPENTGCKRKRDTGNSKKDDKKNREAFVIETDVAIVHTDERVI